MYSVCVANEDYIFDSAFGFETINDANEWAQSHSGHFHVMIENNDAADAGEYPIVKDYWMTK